MKRAFVLTLLLLLLASPVLASVTFTLYPVAYQVLVDGSPINSTLPVMTYKANGGDNTYVPLRAVLDMMGATTTWDGTKVNVQTGADPAVVANSVVQVYVVKDGKDYSRASGVIIDYNEILTCYHVADEGDSFRIVYNDGHTTTAKLVDYDTKEDAAILEPVENDVKPVKLGDSTETIGKVFVISSPKGNRNTILTGKFIDSRLVNNINGFRTTAITESGSSGGGVFNVNGELIGIIQAGDGNWSFAVPINDIRKELIN